MRLHRAAPSCLERIGLCTSASVAILGTVLLCTSVLNAFSSYYSGGGGDVVPSQVPAHDDDDDCAVSFGPYRGPRYVSPGVTVGRPSCMFRSKWLMVSRHAVRVPAETAGGETETDGAEEESGDVIIDDWVWVDYHDRVNVLVQTEGPRRRVGGTGAGAVITRKLDSDDGNVGPADDDDGRRYLVFRQTKYGLGGRPSLAVIGGIIEPDDESAEAAARREVEEETGLRCRTFVPLGRFRTDVNRGMGWVNSFVAKDCGGANSANEEDGAEPDGAAPRANAAAAATSGEEEVGGADGERQDAMYLSHSELREAARAGRFLEVQWSNTVALALIHDHDL